MGHTSTLYICQHNCRSKGRTAYCVHTLTEKYLLLYLVLEYLAASHRPHVPISFQAQEEYDCFRKHVCKFTKDIVFLSTSSYTKDL